MLTKSEYIHVASRVANEVSMLEAQLKNLGPAISMFGGARVGKDHQSYQDAYILAKLAAQNGITTISGGGPGIMEAANKGALEAGGVSVGLNIRLPNEQQPNTHQNLSLEFEYFSVRKAGFYTYAEGYAIFHGGYGTLDELFEVLTLMQTEKIPKKPIVLVDKKYWSGMIDWLRADMLTNNLITPEDLSLLSLADNGYDAWKQLSPNFQLTDTATSIMSM